MGSGEGGRGLLDIMVFFSLESLVTSTYTAFDRRSGNRRENKTSAGRYPASLKMR